MPGPFSFATFAVGDEDMTMTRETAGELAGRVALITGAANGLGARMAQLFAAAGAQVVIADLDETAGRALAVTLPRARFLRLDVTLEADWLAALDSSAILPSTSCQHSEPMPRSMESGSPRPRPQQ